MKRILSALVMSLGLISFCEAKKHKIYIVEYVQCAALQKTKQGLVDGLAELGLRNGENIELFFETAQGNPSLLPQIKTKIMSRSKEQDTTVIGLGTLASKTFSSQAPSKQIRLIFSSVTDPVGANLVETLENPQKASGVSNFVDIESQIKLIKKIHPELSNIKIGFIYNPSELNSISLIKKMETIFQKLNVKLVLQSASKTSEIAQATTAIVKKVDVIFISNDTTALSALKTIVSIATKSKKPVYVSDTDSVENDGAVAACGPNQYDIGKQTAEMVYLCIKKKKHIGQIPVQFPKKQEIVINQSAAARIGIKFPNSLCDKARIVR
jgi:putative ABC transport system substrate-binding protein